MPPDEVDRTSQPTVRLAVALTAHDSIRTIRTTLESLRDVADRIVVVDSGSRDGTVECSRECGAEVIHRPWAGHVAQKQFAIEQCVGADWVLLLDSDEALDAHLRASLQSAVRRDDHSVAGYELNRRLVLHGRALVRAFQPEWRLRLFRSGSARIDGIPPHDFVAVTGGVARLDGDLLHDSWADADDMLRRQIGYAQISAAQAAPSELRGGSLVDVLVRPGAAFAKQYVMKRGFRDGWRGMVAAGGSAASTLMKHLVIAERRGLDAERSQRSS